MMPENMLAGSKQGVVISMGKRQRLWVVLVLVLLLSCCGAPKNEYALGDTVSTYWFDFAAENVERGDTYADYQAQEDTDLIICYLQLKNTFDEAIPMGWMDFALVWTGGEESGIYPLTVISKEQLPEVYHLEIDERISGQLVFEVPETATGLYLVFQERYAETGSEADYKEGFVYRVALD